MSTQAVSEFDTRQGVPELTDLGKRLEILRIERGVSKQHLARYAGTSRQQLWRVMTGKSELTGGLRSRLADVLQTQTLDPDRTSLRTRSVSSAARAVAPVSVDVVEYLRDPALVASTLVTM